MLGVAAGVTASAASAFLAYAVRGPSAAVFGPSVHRGCRERRSVALTFDDGPSEGTLPLLEELARQQAIATFFQCGANVERLPEVARAVRAAGHEIGNHSQTHPLFCSRSPRIVESEFRRAQEAIVRITGAIPVLLRAPFGARWFGFRRMQRRLHLLGVMWTVIGYDWSLEADRIVARVLRGVAQGAIICLHDGRELRVNPDVRETVVAVRRLVPLLRAQGYRFETVSQLLCPTN
jgi:peptidoglycan/xylan/chitin deacetylase (PgdA/CDA1 family)